MDLDLVRAVLGIENPSVLAESGLYTWTDAGNPGLPVLYVGEAGNVLSRTNHERTWAAEFQELRDSGQSPWHAAGCALDVVLAAAIKPIVAMRPMDKQQRVATEIALVRLAAITGGTPPAQGGGWDWGRERSASSQAASSMLYQWFTPEHPLAVALAQSPQP